ncbi:MAG: hypothetical protein GXO58_05615 [Thermodesulfobacteria bacterium]|nr:hypothetical protein [Thermodesulfobacteriota bacterium]
MSKNLAKISSFLWSMVFTGLIFSPSIWAHPAIQLLDRNGQPIAAQLDQNDQIQAANGAVYVAGPPYSPKATCGKCHDYQAVTRAYHFREGVGPNGENYSDTWSDKNNDGTLYKYLANAYGHLLSPGQYGAW